MKEIEKRYLIDKDERLVTITLEDLTDAYVDETALGIIGRIFISPEGIAIYPTSTTGEDDINEQILTEEFRKMFGTEECNLLSGEYYNKILEMSKNGILQSLGYVDESRYKESYLDVKSNKKRPR